MKLIFFLVKEFGHILVNKNHKSALLKGITLYKKTPIDKKKTFLKCINEISFLYNYWNTFPDTYFRFGMFLKEYTDKDKMKSFIPQGAYNRYALSSNKRYNILIDDKILYHDLMTFYGLPVPHRYFIFRNNEFRIGNELLTDSDVENILKGISDDRIFVKKFTGGAASGISIFRKVKSGFYIDQDNEEVSAAMIRRKYAGNDYIFEKQIKQERTLSQFNPDTVNTIRVLTYKNKIISATVRFGGKGEFVDNVSANGLAVSIDINSGCLGSYGLKMYSTTEKFYEHPDSHIKFEHTVVEQWEQICKVIERTLDYLPYYKSVGFDIATTLEGPVILEINTGVGINLSQMGKEYGLADKFLDKSKI